MRETARITWAWRWLDALALDVRYGLRAFRRSPGFTAVAVLTLALGLGANTAIFAVLYNVVLRPLPYPDADRLVKVYLTAARELFPGQSPIGHHIQAQRTDCEIVGVAAEIHYEKQKSQLAIVGDMYMGPA